MSNPYQSPEDDSALKNEGRVRQVLMWYRIQVACLLIRLILIGCIVPTFLLMPADSRAGSLIGSYCVIARFLVTITSGASIIIASIMSNRPLGFLWAFLNFVPCLGLVALLMAAIQTRSDLQEYGLGVGFFRVQPPK
jgi:hypothetical protein